MLENNLHSTLPNVSKEYIVSFDFKIKSYKPWNAWKSIIHFTTGAGKDSPGFRHPAAFIHNVHGSLYICSQVGSSYNRCYTHHTAAPLNQWISVEVAQEMEEVGGKYMYQVKCPDASSCTFDNITTGYKNIWASVTMAIPRDSGLSCPKFGEFRFCLF